MKPLKLKMTAFGPYKHTETVDFQELKDNKLFVISGNTGAGKTTIFDGICFALYGSASGTDREDHKMLRSDFADDHTHTSVELEFELHGRTYRILRQLGHVKQGNKSKTGEKYEFYEKVDGKEIPCVDRQMVSEIDKKVEAIIGLTQDQFKQIVMLPQGEFRKLLTSQTENKEAILRRLFKTESYKYMNEILKNKKNMVEQEYRQVQQNLEQFVQNIRVALPTREESSLFQVLAEEHYNVNQIVTGLEEEAIYYQEQIDIDQENYNKAYEAHAKKQEELSSAKALNDRFVELDQKENQLKSLQEQIPHFDSKEKQLEKAERASHIEVYEKQTSEWRQEEKAKKNSLASTKAAKERADQQLETAKTIYQQEEQNKTKLEEVGKQLDRLKEILPTVKDIAKLERELEELRLKGTQASKRLENAKEKLEKKKHTTEETNKKIKQMDLEVSKLHEKSQKLTEMRQHAIGLKAFLSLQRTSTDLKQDVNKKKEAFLKVKETYAKLEEAWVNNQASILASHLHDGEACPVCGSLEHPNKAINDQQAVSKDELDVLKKELDEKDGLYRSAVAKQETTLSQLKEQAEELASLDIRAEEAESVNKTLIEEGTKLGKEVEHLKQLKEDLEKQKELNEKATEEVKQLEAQKEELDRTYQELRTSYKTSKAVYEERLRNIPEEVRVLSKLEQEINETEQRKKQLEKAWEDAQKMLEQAKENQTKAASNLDHAVKQLEETKSKAEKAEMQFMEELKKASFESEDAYHQAKQPELERNQLKKTIQEFNESLSTVKQQVSDLKEYLKDKTRVDLEAMQRAVGELKEAYESAYKKLNASKEFYQEAIQLKANILATDDQASKLEKKLATITDLYDVARGQNGQKISFERYLQIEYLEQIIDAANERLRRLSNGQYYLIRSDRQESHGRQSGLALDVYDAYTGQTRDVKTLSGGEKFNASLCLALGMSDVIQSFQGNISINTMFIDEGFGSLDEESLNKSIDTLIDLQQSGRTIGVISHVQELKNMFPAILQVSKTKEGHSQTKFLVK
ncbi:AAA family ATPase [Ornithinibacillus sp. L9]|uniref:Nuclease SbcCD subunit C n=1 Tax=Ornithinibacillus caprae TaxID=2678566 RepID=A0A6N8FMD1_9BACI|nr:SMC family ATPase [Ornithinibacillus caprae]MUK90762.1 AAA family ATPase [Ornithinibacillus caprae]